MKLSTLVIYAAFFLVACEQKNPTELGAYAPSTVQHQAELWGGAKKGMNPEEVLTTSPSIQKFSAPGAQLGNGAEQLLELRGIEIAGAKFTGQYYFLNNTLEQVTLQLDAFGMIFSTAKSVADEVKDALTAKYGPPLSCEGFSGGLMKGYSCNWARQDGNVRLFLSAFDESKPTLNIVYQDRLAKASANL